VTSAPYRQAEANVTKIVSARVSFIASSFPEGFSHSEAFDEAKS